MKEMNPAMKKTIAWILALAMFSTSAMALAENTPPQMPQGENGQPSEMPNGQKPGNPPDSGMGGPGGQSGKPDSYDAVTTVSTDTEISGETIESTGKDENALLVTDGTTTVTNSTIVRDSDESTGGDHSSFYGVGAAVLTTGGTVSISDSTLTNLACEGEIVDAAGNVVSVVGTDGAVYVQGDSEYTVTVGNYAETCDLTGAGKITGWDASVMPM